MKMYIVQRPDKTKNNGMMLHTLSETISTAWKSAVAGSGSWDWDKFEREGYKVVPVVLAPAEPTEKMIIAAAGRDFSQEDRENVTAEYKLMLAAI